MTISPKTNDRSSIPICVPASLRCQTLQAIVTAQDEELLTSPAMPPLFFCVTQERCQEVTPARGHQCSTLFFASVKYTRMSLQLTASKITVNVMPHI